MHVSHKILWKNVCKSQYTMKNVCKSQNTMKPSFLCSKLINNEILGMPPAVMVNKDKP